jgi:putative ABC transport system ATP-binding protein
MMELREEINAAGTTIMMATHDPELAVRTHRSVHIIGGQVSDLERKGPTYFKLGVCSRRRNPR